MQTTYRGVVKGGAIVLENGSSMFPDGTEVFITPVVPERGTAAAILAAVEGSPQLDPDDIRELERAIESGKRPIRDFDPFAE